MAREEARHGLLVCISDYEEGTRLGTLEGSRADERRSRTTLEDLNFQVTSLTQGALSAQELDEGVERFVEELRVVAKAGRRCVAFVVISCHGALSKGKETLLLTSEGGSVELEEAFFQRLNSIESYDGLDCFFVLDCCQSCEHMDTCKRAKGFKLLPELRHAFYIVYACDPGSKAWERPDGGGGYAITEVMDLVRYREPASKVMHQAAKNVTENALRQNAWYRERPGVPEPVLGYLVTPPGKFPVPEPFVHPGRPGIYEEPDTAPEGLSEFLRQEGEQGGGLDGVASLEIEEPLLGSGKAGGPLQRLRDCCRRRRRCCCCCCCLLLLAAASHALRLAEGAPPALAAATSSSTSTSTSRSTSTSMPRSMPTSMPRSTSTPASVLTSTATSTTATLTPSTTATTVTSTAARSWAELAPWVKVPEWKEENLYTPLVLPLREGSRKEETLLALRSLARFKEKHAFEGTYRAGALAPLLQITVAAGSEERRLALELLWRTIACGAYYIRSLVEAGAVPSLLEALSHGEQEQRLALCSLAHLPQQVQSPQDNYRGLSPLSPAVPALREPERAAAAVLCSLRASGQDCHNSYVCKSYVQALASRLRANSSSSTTELVLALDALANNTDVWLPAALVRCLSHHEAFVRERAARLLSSFAARSEHRAAIVAAGAVGALAQALVREEDPAPPQGLCMQTQWQLAFVTEATECSARLAAANTLCILAKRPEEGAALAKSGALPTLLRLAPKNFSKELADVAGGDCGEACGGQLAILLAYASAASHSHFCLPSMKPFRQDLCAAANASLCKTCAALGAGQVCQVGCPSPQPH